MSINKLALIRYKAIDECLANRFRKWTLEDLIEKVSETLYELEGIHTGVSRRTIQADIQLMRSDKLGYNAPIVVKDKKYYAYDDPNFSIMRSPINTADVEKLKEVVEVLKQFSGFSYFHEMSVMVAKLENNLLSSVQGGGERLIQFEGNPLLKGLPHLSGLYAAVRTKTPLLIEYRSFTAAKESQHTYFPYLLKEFRNRWFLIARKKKTRELMTLALDRIVAFQELTKEAFQPWEGVDFDRYYDDLIGVTKHPGDRAHKVILFVNKHFAPYVLTKPLHHSQTLLKQDEAGIILQINVVLNFELEREILGFGDGMKVLGPRMLAGRVRKRLLSAAAMYEKKLTEVAK